MQFIPRLLLSVFAATALSASEPAPVKKLGSTLFPWESLVVRPTPNGQRRDVAELPTATLETFECHVTTLRAGMESHPPHRHAQEEFIILQEGTLDVSINGVTRRVGPGSLFFFASNDLHNVKNVGDDAATYFVFNLKTAATRNVPQTAAAQSAPKGTLPSSVFEWSRLNGVPSPTGERRAIFESPTVTCRKLEAHVTTQSSSAPEHPPLKHPDEEVILVKDGTINVKLNGKTHRLGPGSICFFASNDEHTITAFGEKPATYYAVRIVTESTPKS